MTISTAQAAKTMASILNWNVTNLELQKMLYIAHLFFLGRTGQELVDEEFEAWDYGPVLPSLYREVKFFGSDTIMDVFQTNTANEDSIEFQTLKEMAKHLSSFTAGQLVNITHHRDSAWAHHYKPRIMGIKIPRESIELEYTTLYEHNDE